jgi:hypothetical protein
VLQQKCGLGYISNWAKENFKSAVEKNEFFRKLGDLLQPEQEDKLVNITADWTPGQILEKIN